MYSNPENIFYSAPYSNNILYPAFSSDQSIFLILNLKSYLNNILVLKLFYFVKKLLSKLCSA